MEQPGLCSTQFWLTGWLELLEYYKIGFNLIIFTFKAQSPSGDLANTSSAKSEHTKMATTSQHDSLPAQPKQTEGGIKKLLFNLSKNLNVEDDQLHRIFGIVTSALSLASSLTGSVLSQTKPATENSTTLSGISFIRDVFRRVRQGGTDASWHQILGGIGVLLVAWTCKDSWVGVLWNSAL